MGTYRFTREIVTADGAIKLVVKVLPDNNKFVVLSDDTLRYAATLDPIAANSLGKFLLHAANIAAMNTISPATPQPTGDNDDARD